ncbi:GAF domain-containing protein [Geofilum rubicundum]|uniref:GAF domain-containing protein n=1 Tax=Geofilum rubicundum JCM 15548 TaxID=1236989 RepID=A0A0E9M1X8_9BACT|nr:GAF domain-containing protein [Geofilum rubicundum]GAO31767.1 hypothetical protein JCM15548_14165 [Geofilum rubicundum JCM 15548]
MKPFNHKIPGKNFAVRLFVFAALGFGLSMAKMLFFPSQTVAMVYILDFLALLLFLIVVYTADLYYRKSEKQLSQQRALFNKEKEAWADHKNLLIRKLSDYEQKEKEASQFASYQEKMLKKIFSDPKSIQDRHHLLHLLSETFRAGAAILYRETEQLGQFVVEQTYALPEDYHPNNFEAGEGLNGQVVNERTPMVIHDLDEAMLPVTSGLGQSEGACLYLLPVVLDDRCKYLIEMVTFHEAEIDKMWNEIVNQLVDKHIL